MLGLKYGRIQVTEIWFKSRWFIPYFKCSLYVKISALGVLVLELEILFTVVYICEYIAPRYLGFGKWD